MIKNLKDKRTSLEKDIEEESVDIKNLREKLQKVSEYIDEENRGIKELAIKRKQVENEADEVGSTDSSALTFSSLFSSTISPTSSFVNLSNIL